MLSLYLLGKPKKKKLVYTVNVTEKGMSDLELESDLTEPISSGKITGPETFETHFTATELEASKEKAAQEEEKDVVTLETFGLPPVTTKVSLATDGGEAQSSTVQNEKSDENQPVTSKDEENTLKKVAMCNCYHSYYFIMCICVRGLSKIQTLCQVLLKLRFTAMGSQVIKVAFLHLQMCRYITN